MKKLLYCICVVLLCVSLFTACNDGNDPPANNPDSGIVNNDTSNSENSNNTNSETEACQHIYGDWKTITEADCLNGGEKIRVCTKCSVAETEEINALGHTTGSSTCNRCGKYTGTWTKEEVQKIVQVHDVYVAEINSADGVDMRISWTNTSDKTIKYIHFYVEPYNSVGDKMYCDIRDHSRFDAYVTGPCEPGYKGYYNVGETYYGDKWETCWYNSSIKTIKLTGIKIIYMDGSVVDLDNSAAQMAFAPYNVDQTVASIGYETDVEYYSDEAAHCFYFSLKNADNLSVKADVNVDIHAVNTLGEEVYSNTLSFKTEDFFQHSFYGDKTWIASCYIYDWELLETNEDSGYWYYRIYSDDGSIDFEEKSVYTYNLPLIDWALYSTLQTHGYYFYFSNDTWITLEDTYLGKTIVIDSINYEFSDTYEQGEVNLSVTLTGKNIGACENGFYISGYFVIPDTDTKEFFGGRTSATQDGERFEITLTSNYIPGGDYVMEFSNRLIDTNGLVYNLTEDLNSYSVSAYEHSATSISIPETFNGKNVTSIVAPGFYNHKTLTSIHLPKTIKDIGYGIFEGCDSLKTISVDSNNPNCYSDGNCIIGRNSKTVYAGCNNSTIPNDAVEIGDWAFCGNTIMESITIPDSIERIGVGAFWGCAALKSITIKSANVVIDEDAFDQCTSLTELDLTGVKRLEYSAFWGCENLSKVYLDSTLEYIGTYVFDSCYENITVYYDGTKSQWNSVNKEEDWYGTNSTVTVKCSDGDIYLDKIILE
ncbi:MAG: leucine-rich repeat domain-containing protein [Clostridia bacterium]|nr:leucine-rich repeat domain-containing protein [Clostridia bacterium]